MQQHFLVEAFCMFVEARNENKALEIEIRGKYWVLAWQVHWLNCLDRTENWARYDELFWLVINALMLIQRPYTIVECSPPLEFFYDREISNSQAVANHCVIIAIPCLRKKQTLIRKNDLATQSFSFWTS